VFDKFHIVSNYSKVIDQVRKSETKKASTEQKQKVIKGSRWLLLKNEKNLKDKEKPNGILNYALYPIHTSKLEGTNNKIKEIKRSAYGFHDNRYFALKIKQAFPGNI